MAGVRHKASGAMSILWNLACVFFLLAVLPIESLFAFKQAFVLIMSALVALALFDESRNTLSPD
jgi:hypothetical protein